MGESSGLERGGLAGALGLQLCPLCSAPALPHPSEASAGKVGLHTPPTLMIPEL